MMDEYQRAFEKAMSEVAAEHAKIERAIALACAMKLKCQGIDFNRAVSALTACITLKGADAFQAEVSADVASLFGIPIDKVESTIGALRLADIERAVKVLRKALQNRATQTLERIGVEYLDRVRRAKPKILRELRREHRGFSRRLERDWRDSLDNLLFLIWLCRETGSSVNAESRNPLTDARRKRVETLTRLHARACQTALEIHLLITNGFADGAQARWRTLYELSIVAAFIAKHGRSAARLYTEHHVVGERKQAEAYDKTAIARGLDRIPTAEYRRIQRRFDSVRKRHGKAFTTDYGWAAVTLKLPAMTFSDLIDVVDHDYFREQYSASNDNVHATTLGLYFRLGLHETHDEVLLAGPSNLGLRNVVLATAESLIAATDAVCSLATNIDRMSARNVMRELLAEIAEKSWQTEDDILKRGEATAYALRDGSETKIRSNGLGTTRP